MTSDHPLVLDLGSVVGPQGPAGPAGHVIFGTGAPAPETGGDGDVYIDKSSGGVYKNTSGTWTLEMSVPTTVDQAVDESSSNPVSGAAVAAAVKVLGSADMVPTQGVTTNVSTVAKSYRKGFMGLVGISSYDSWQFGLNTVPYEFADGYDPYYSQLLPAWGTIDGVDNCYWLMAAKNNGTLSVATLANSPTGAVLSTGQVTAMTVYGAYIGEW